MRTLHPSHFFKPLIPLLRNRRDALAGHSEPRKAYNDCLSALLRRYRPFRMLREVDTCSAFTQVTLCCAAVLPDY